MVNPKTQALENLFEKLLTKYTTALDADVEFEELKKIYLELKDVTVKLSQLRKLSHLE